MNRDDAESVVTALDRYLASVVARDNLDMRSVATTARERLVASQLVGDARDGLVAALTATD